MGPRRESMELTSSRCIDDLTDETEKRVQMLLKEGANTMMDFNWIKPELPEFFDKEKFDLGQRTFYNNVFTMMVAKLAGLLSLMAIPTIADVIMFTRQSATSCNAFRRYASTILHTWIWYRKEPNVENEFLRSLKIVRKKHCVAFRRSAEAGLQRASQLDMALAQFGFIGFTLLSGDFLGVNATDEELESLVHFWRVIGSMLGMEDKFNICNGTLEETRALCRRLLEDIFLPGLRKDNKTFMSLCRTLIEGLWPVNPHLDVDAFVTFTLHLASQSVSNNNHSIRLDTTKMSRYSRFMLNFQLFVHKYLMPTTKWWSQFFRAYFNGQTRLSIFLTENFPFLAYWTYGWRKSHVNVLAYHVN